MSEKSRHTPPNVRIVAKNDQTWSVDWADDPNEYCRSFNTRARELNLGLVATTHFPKPIKLKRLWFWSTAVCLLGLAAYGTHWLFAPVWIFHTPKHDMVFRYPTRIHLWCNSPPSHFIHFRERPKKEVKVGRARKPLYDSKDVIGGFTFGEEDNRVSYPVETFKHLRDDQMQPTLIP